MPYCQRCRIELFGGSICDTCGGELTASPTEEKPKRDILVGKQTRVKAGLTENVPMKMARLTLEIIIFNGLFVGGTYVLMTISNWLSEQMQTKIGTINIYSPGIRYFWVIGCIIVTILTIKYRLKEHN